MMPSLHDLPAAALIAFDPSKGKGWTESIISIMIVGATIWAVFDGKEVPQIITLALGTIMGWYFGTKTIEYKGDE